jgi:3-oxoacyl-[acyl-carrier-protein] synthase-3
VERYGNTSAASIPIGIDEARASGRLRPGDLIAVVAFGAGFTWGSAVLRL